MASPPPPPAAAAAGAPPPPAQVVGNAFVHQYYNILHQSPSPELVYRFYQDASRLGRPAKPGADMDVVTTMEVKPASPPLSPLSLSRSPPPRQAQIWASAGSI
ncbi:hypothetical protein PR202_ga20626 [Eleusine coracana subsp. coracana]|uniref:NTF2 domain-containing protein n=1 Tax=Eleusine coracana subsp. coracana TaxID=191504 RepID=A0AAV5CX62_ELECO|nr:hypothetical protein PR202_ga20626 [Eleusine coracana subsp. coracana]